MSSCVTCANSFIVTYPEADYVFCELFDYKMIGGSDSKAVAEGCKQYCGFENGGEWNE